MSTEGVALLLIDVINDFEFVGGKQMFRQGLPAATNIRQLKQRAKSLNIPVIYVNDNFGKWQDDFKATVQHCLDPACRGKDIVEMLLPEEDDYFVLKPRHSAFYSTVLNVLLQKLAVNRLILCGFSTDICLLLSASDAYMREYTVLTPSDCTAAVKPDDHQYAINYMARVLKADTRPSAELDLACP